MAMENMTLQRTPQETMIAVAKFVKRVRLDREMTIEELALRVGISKSSIIRLEKLGAGSIGSLVKIFTALGVLDSLTSALVPPEKELTIAELKKTSTQHQRVRGKGKPRELSRN
jgi:transcriptional regulator with XRE-family HTH domain